MEGRIDLTGDELPSSLEAFLWRHVGPDRQLTLRLHRDRWQPAGVVGIGFPEAERNPIFGPTRPTPKPVRLAGCTAIRRFASAKPNCFVSASMFGGLRVQAFPDHRMFNDWAVRLPQI
jgi:hypothetical protein